MPDPNVMVRTGEVEQRTRVLAAHEVESLENALGAHQQVIGATSEGYLSGEQGSSPVLPPGMRLNRQRLSEQARQIQDTLKRGRPEPVSEKDRDAFLKRANWLKTQFAPYLETREEIHVRKRDNPAWQSATEKARIRTQEKPEIERYISEWQSIMRRLEPENPGADSLHKLRMSK